jgi:hypothetical protein
VKVIDGVNVIVGVYVMGVYVGDGVIVGDGVNVSVGKDVLVGIRVDVAAEVGELPPITGAWVTSMEILNRTVRELVEEIVLAIKGRNLGTMGVYCSATVTLTRWVLSDRIALLRLGSVFPDAQYVVGVLSAGPSSHWMVIVSNEATYALPLAAARIPWQSW